VKQCIRIRCFKRGHFNVSLQKPLCDHNRLVIRWTDSGLVSQTGVIVALCREDSPSTTRRHNASVYVSDDFGLNWRNLSGDFSKLLKKRATIDMYYLDPDTPSNVSISMQNILILFYLFKYDVYCLAFCNCCVMFT
jgi:hypothetical protein